MVIFSGHPMVIFSGILIALSFPSVFFGLQLPNLGFLAWFGLVPLVSALQKATPHQAFWKGFFTAAIFFLIGYYWIYAALHDYGDISVLSSGLTTALLAGVMAIYIGLACCLAVWFAKKDASGGLLLWLPVFWTLAEFARAYTPFGGFPWAHLAISQGNYTLLIQIADLTGYYGVLFLLVWVNVWITESLTKISKPKTVATGILLFSVLGYGFYQTGRVDKEAAGVPALKVGLIQPNIPQEEKWVPAHLPKHRKIFAEAVADLQAHVDLMIWPETAWFETLWQEAETVDPKKIGVTLPRAEGKPFTLLGLSFVTVREKRERYYNSAALIDADGRIWGKYHKVRLVPFGEYVPLKKLFSFLKPVAAIGDFEQGERWSPLTLGYWKIAPLICYEDIFPQASRAMARQGANLLINITNDAWYGFSSAAYQHLALAQFRAVETRRAMVRATNTGITAVIDPAGRISVQAPWFEQSLIVHRVPLLSKKTVYTKLGNWFVAGLLLVVLLQGIKLWRKS